MSGSGNRFPPYLIIMKWAIPYVNPSHGHVPALELFIALYPLAPEGYEK